MVVRIPALGASARNSIGGIHVDVLGDKIILDGKIKAWHERNVAEQAA
ncbi:hypothetical protein GCM10007874_15470 [Labrys miyagiensis]|uniref:Uncharacterized protein n=1 Tax=Labrys miyagiensis TaxID=346912 RepID=A0ABQ6CEE3_9HYPH|nr:hypothetical protein [Labrys miyagiensis]GLS18530.1 hypothetical protein GCM10007874_15470 [Labrys miyagiensis]